MELKPNFELSLIDNSIYGENKIQRVIGIDEVGRGCWAGPVAVCGYIFHSSSQIHDHIKDSKKLTAINRSKLFASISESEYVLKWGTPEMIDKYGIAKTIEKLILRIIDEYSDESTFFIIDGQFSQEFGKNVFTTWHADSNYYSVACASIIAKVARDSLMDDMSRKYLYYRFDRNKGYGTKDHAEALEKYGVCEIHRKSYKPVILRSAQTKSL